jgi:glutamyl-Q tRNA(Asp) synthetase
MIRTRFAPSPTGYLHIGHALAAREAFSFAQKTNGHCLLRIEDTDHTRCKPEFTQSIYKDLDWLGFDWPLPVRVQSQNYPAYGRVVMELIERGLAYPCYLTRSDIKSGQTPSAPAALNPSEASRLSNALSEACHHAAPVLPYAIRLNLKKALACLSRHALTFEEMGEIHKGVHDARDFIENIPDPIIARKDIGCSYLIAGPHDDTAQGVTHVVRGADLFKETPLQVVIQTLMGWPRPLYFHHTLVKNESGEKLAKRNLDTTLKSLREAGQTPEDIWKMTK